MKINSAPFYRAGNRRLLSDGRSLEADVYGNVNSTHVPGTKMMNGIGGRNPHYLLVAFALH